MKINISIILSLIFVAIFTLSATNMVYAVTQLAIPPTITVGSSPEYVAYDSGKGEIFVTNEGDGTVSVISDSTNSVVATVIVGKYPCGIVYDSGKGELFVSNSGANTVSVISDSTNAVVATIPVGANPRGEVYDPAKGEVFVANFDDNTVSVISDSTNAVVANITTGKGAWGGAYDSGKGEIFISNEGASTVSVISDNTNKVVATIDVNGNAPEGLAYDPAKGELFVADYDSSSFSVLSDQDNTMVATVGLTGYAGDPNSMVYDSTNGEVFLTCLASADVFVIGDNNNAVLAWIPLVQLPITDESFGPLPSGIAYDSAKGELFVADSGSNAVSIIPDPSLTSGSTNTIVTPSSNSTFNTLFIVIGALIAVVVVGIIGYFVFAGRRVGSMRTVGGKAVSSDPGINATSGRTENKDNNVIAAGSTDQGQQDPEEPDGQPGGRAERFGRFVRKFQEKGATSPEKAMTAEQLGLSSLFVKFMERRKGQTKVFVEVNGRYYLDEKALEETRQRMAKR